MKAITLTQPWAPLVALAAKPIETRSWKTSFRGDIAIHAAKGFPKTEKRLCYKPPFFGALAPMNAVSRFGSTLTDVLPLGEVVAVARIVDCTPAEWVKVDSTVPDGAWRRGTDPFSGLPYIYVSEMTYAFGDFSPGRYAWLLADIRSLPEPVPAKGALSLWEWEAV